MVSPKWPIFLLIMTVTLTFINSMVEGIYFGGSTANTLSTLMGTDIAIGDRLSAFWVIISFDYAMFENEYVIFRYVFGAIGIGTLFVILLSLVSGVVGLAKRFI